MKDIQLAKAVEWLVDAWKSVKSETIVNCFHRVGTGNLVLESAVPAVTDDIENEVEEIAFRVGINDLEVDEQLETEGTDEISAIVDWEEDILNRMDDVVTPAENPEEEDDDDDDDDDDDAPIIPTATEVRAALATLEKWLWFREEDDIISLHLQPLASHATKVREASIVQGKITNFIKPTNK